MALSTADIDQRGSREGSPGLRLVIVCLLSIALMALDERNQILQDVRRLLAAAAYPIQILVDSPFALGSWLGESLATREQLLSENETLRRERLMQNARLQRMDALLAENARLRALLDSTEKVADRVLIAEIMAVDMDPFRHRIVINKGSRDGVFVGQAMIDADGVVGQVTRDRVFSSEAILVTDVDHALPVEILRSGQRSIAVGTGDLNRLSLPFLPRNADVEVGDLLVTSGLGGTFPAGYPVGTVTGITAESGEPFLGVSAEPSAALSRVREVLLVWPGATTPTEVDMPGADGMPGDPDPAAAPVTETPATPPGPSDEPAAASAPEQAPGAGPPESPQ